MTLKDVTNFMMCCMHNDLLLIPIYTLFGGRKSSPASACMFNDGAVGSSHISE
eukprot:m.123341 g.123341  ORF g.123341 m.123341 type:complete len:53 (-) comp16245_c2_seq2:858-1016(-)